jgi:pectate lyase
LVDAGADAPVHVYGPDDPNDPDTSRDRHHEEILRFNVGFGRNTQGGKGGELCEVTTLADSGPGSLRACATGSEPRWIRFGVSGTIVLDDELLVGSSKTIDGRGQHVTISGAGLGLVDVHDVIITHVEFADGNGYVDWENENTIEGNDAITLRNAHDVWVHQSTFQRYGDGLIDMRDDTTDVTVSWCKFTEHFKVMLVNASADTRLTTHHNWYLKTGKRQPQLQYGRAHSYDNLHQTFVQFGAAAADDGQIFSESNIYIADYEDNGLLANLAGYGPGKTRSVGDYLIDDPDIEQRLPEEVFDPKLDYEYSAEAADDFLRMRLETLSGYREVPFPGGA